MRAAAALSLIPAMVAVLTASPAAKQNRARPASRPMVLIGEIPMPGVEGRLDHFALGAEGRLFVSAYGNNTEEILSLPGETVVGSISVPNPQGVVYAPESEELFVGSDQGQLYIYQAPSFRLMRKIDFGDDVDYLRYNAATRSVYVGFGDGPAGAIGTVQATTNTQVGKPFKLGAHPEAFALEENGPNIFVNLPTLHQIAVIDRRTGAVARWHLTLEGNFPMALDEADHRLFVATHAPPRLAVFDTNSGRLMATLPCVPNEDDMFYDRTRKRIYITGGAGFISVFQQQDPDHYQLLANVPSALGARTSGYWGKTGKGFDRFYVGVPARACQAAGVLIYTVQN